jgi:hypothetical protein
MDTINDVYSHAQSSAASRLIESLTLAVFFLALWLLPFERARSDMRPPFGFRRCSRFARATRSGLRFLRFLSRDFLDFP